MTGTDLRGLVLKTAGGFAAAGVVFVVMFFVVGVNDVIAEFRNAKLPVIPLLLGMSLLWLLSWSVTLKTVLASLDIDAGYLSSALMYSSAVFANNVTPFGQAGGEPITAGVLSKTLDTEYETGLAAIASVDTINFIPSITFAFVGLGVYATQATLGDRLEFASVVLVVMAAAIGLGLAGAWRYRGRLEDIAVSGGSYVLQVASHAVPFVSTPSEDKLRERVTTFVESIEAVRNDDGSLKLAFVASAAGWFFQMVALWLAFYAIGLTIPLYIPLFAIPVAATAGVTPLPGGTGGIETVLIGVLLAAGVANPATVTAGVVLFRGVIYWFQLLLGGFSVGVVTGWQVGD